MPGKLGVAERMGQRLSQRIRGLYLTDMPTSWSGGVRADAGRGACRGYICHVRDFRSAKREPGRVGDILNVIFWRAAKNREFLEVLGTEA